MNYREKMMNKIQEYLGFTRKSCPGIKANKAFMVVLILGIICFGSSLAKGVDNKTIVDPPRTPGGFPKILDDNKWSSQILYDTIGACYQGTIKWIILSNPSLLGQVPGPMAQRQMVEHCFCVMDKIRKEIEYREYIKKVTDLNWTGNFFMIKAMECVAEYKTLPSFFATQMKPSDNETTIKPEESEDSKDELPSQKPKESKEDSTTIFQG